MSLRSVKQMQCRAIIDSFVFSLLDSIEQVDAGKSVTSRTKASEDVLVPERTKVAYFGTIR